MRAFEIDIEAPPRSLVLHKRPIAAEPMTLSV
jgi:hypothetical protein